MMYLVLSGLGLAHIYMLPAGPGTSEPVFWGYTVPNYLLTIMGRAIHLSRLIVVLDLDETLLKTHTMDTLQQRLMEIKQAVYVAWAGGC